MIAKVPMAPLMSPMSTQKLEVSMTRALCARQMMDSKPPASSDEALEAFGPLWTALMVATGWPLGRSLEMLCSTTASTVGWR